MQKIQKQKKKNRGSPKNQKMEKRPKAERAS